MNRVARRVAVAAGSLAAVGVVWYAAQVVYFGPHRAATAALARTRDAVQSYESALERIGSGRELRARLGATTLGNDPERVAHFLRILLSDAAARGGLTDIVVDHGRPSPRPSPAEERAAGLTPAMRKQIEDAATFSSVSARVQGVGTLEQALRTLAVLQAQPWVHRFVGFSLEPVGRERRRFELKADVVTLSMPGLRPSALGDPVLTEPSVELMSRAVGLARMNPFVSPPRVAPEAPPEVAPVVEVAAPVPAPTPPPEPPAYLRWRLVGVIETGRGVEVLVRRSDTDEGRALRVGDDLFGAVLESAAGERAVFVIDGVRLEVRSGESLSQGRGPGSVD